MNDDLEVVGFDFAGKHWYSDPLEASTLKDEIADSKKCSRLATSWNCALDTDGDNTPDLFDRDIDGDSVPNSQDPSPIRKARWSLH